MMATLYTRIAGVSAAGFPIVGLALAVAVFSGAPAATQSAGSTELAQKPANEIQRFCGNIVDAARDQRYALQEAELKKLQADIDERVKRLEAKRAEYEDWLTRRQKFMAQAELGVVQIYSKMRPEAAAAQLTQLRTVMAASILMKLDTRTASVIMNEMDKTAAATLTSIMVSAARPEDPS